MTTTKFGNSDNQVFSPASPATDVIGYKLIFGDGNNDSVQAPTGSVDNNTITFGDGTGDSVQAQDDISGNVITFGDGAAVLMFAAAFVAARYAVAAERKPLEQVATPLSAVT
jgi:hypothetical protein